MAKSLFDKILSAYQEDYFEYHFEEDGEEGSQLFKVMLERCRAYFQVAARQAYLDCRGKDNGKNEFARFLAKALLADVQFKDSLSGVKTDDPKKQPKDLRPLAKKLLAGTAPIAANKRDIAAQLHLLECNGAYTTKLTWKQLVALTNEMFEAAGALPQTLKDAPLFEEYRLSLECQKYQKARKIKSEKLALSQYEKLQQEGDARKAKRLAKAQRAVVRGTSLYGVAPKDEFAYLRIEEFKKVCEAWMYDRGYSVAGAYAEYDKKKKTPAPEDEFSAPEAPGRTDYLARVPKIDMPFIERYYQVLSTDSPEGVTFDANTKADIDRLLKGLAADGFKEVALPLHVDSTTGAGLFLVDTKAVGGSAVGIKTPYALIVAPFEAASSVLLGTEELQYSEAEAYGTNDKELAYTHYAALVAGEFGESDLAADYFRTTNTSMNNGILLDCPARYKRFFTE